jgi:hypothetical protein
VRNREAKWHVRCFIKARITSVFFHSTQKKLHLSRQGAAGFALVELIVALALLTLIVVSSTQALVQANRQSAAMRMLTAARGIVQRNIDTALTVTWNSSVEPAILVVTPNSGSLYDDDAPPASNTDNVVQIAVMQDGTTATVPGQLWRTVTPIANPENAQIRQVTFRLNYTYLSRQYSVQMVTVRAIDD